MNTQKTLTALAVIVAMDNAQRIGPQWLRDTVAADLGIEPTKEWAMSVTYSTIAGSLEGAMYRLCNAAVTREGMAHQAGFQSFDKALTRAFPNAIGKARARISSNAKNEKPAPDGFSGETGMWTSAAVSGTHTGPKGAILLHQAALGVTAKIAKADILDPTADVDTRAVNASESHIDSCAPSLAGAVPKPDDVRFTNDGVKEAIGFAVAKAAADVTRVHEQRIAHIRAIQRRVLRIARAKSATITALRAQLLDSQVRLAMALADIEMLRTAKTTKRATKA
jgi:hypothetical protein